MGNTDNLNYFDKLLGTTINETYLIEEKLGAGGMGAVFRAKHLKEQKTYAIKVISPELATNKTFIKRFQREARVGEVLSHPNIIKVFEYGEAADGLLFMVMEYVEGETLRKYLNSVKRITPQEALEILRPLCEALTAAHKRNILHRDLKPANVLMNQDDKNKVIKLADFGIVKFIQPDSEITAGSNLTGVGEVFGTPQYMSPEQLMGHPVGPPADIYSVGVIAYEMLTGALPINSNDVRELFILKMNDIAPPSQKYKFIPQPFDEVILKVMKVDAEERYQTIDQFLTDFEALAVKFPHWELLGIDNSLSVLAADTVINDPASVPTILSNNLVNTPAKIAPKTNPQGDKITNFIQTSSSNSGNFRNSTSDLTLIKTPPSIANNIPLATTPAKGQAESTGKPNSTNQPATMTTPPKAPQATTPPVTKTPAKPTPPVSSTLPSNAPTEQGSSLLYIITAVIILIIIVVLLVVKR